MTNTTTNITIGLLALATLMGCQNDKEHLKGEIQSEMDQPLFEEEDAPRATRRILQTQVQRGAAGDGYLYAAHFDGSRINSLGEQKLSAMMAGTPEGEPVVIHLNLPEAAASNSAREEAVIAWLGENGLEVDRIQVTSGVNENSRHLATLGTAGVYETKEGTIRSAKPQITDDNGGASQSMTPSMGME